MWKNSPEAGDSNSKIFGIELYEAGLAELVFGYFREMTRALVRSEDLKNTIDLIFR